MQAARVLRAPGDRIAFTHVFGIKQSDGVEDFYTSACPTREPGARPTAYTSECQRMAQKEVRCPYCVVDDKFRPMTILPNGQLICKNCGHIVFPNDAAFRCPCSKCLEINFSPRVRRLRRR
jgi:hypothetical protein